MTIWFKGKKADQHAATFVAWLVLQGIPFVHQAFGKGQNRVPTVCVKMKYREQVQDKVRDCLGEMRVGSPYSVNPNWKNTEHAYD